MLKSHWLIAACVFILVLFIIFGIAWRIRNNAKLNKKPSEYKNPLLWSKPAPIKEDVCHLYQFASITQTVNDVTGTNKINIILPGLPTLNEIVLNSITDDKFKKIPPRNLRCIDSDQILARKGYQVCKNVKNKNIKAKNFCTKNDGINAAPDEEQFFYYNDSDQKNGNKCPSLRPCNGEISLIAINYKPTKDNNYAIGCITKITDDNVILSPCADNNDYLSKQLFRLTRMNYGEDPYATEEDGQGSLTGQNGIFGQILDRENNLCLRRTETAGSDCIIFGTCHGGNYTGTNGTNGVGGPRPGFNWLFIPSTDKATQNLTYVGDINMYDFKRIYTGLTGYKGNTGTTGWTNWLSDNNAKTMAAPICCSSYLYLVPNTVTGDQVTANYFNISNFNLLRKLPACTSAKDQNIIECLGL
jgi:hypothetical protein